MTSLLVTNDFPPKHGGIQTYLYELWRRLPPEHATVLTTPYEGDAEWDADQAFRVVRTSERFLLPKPDLAKRIDALAREIDARVVFLDPMLPVGLVGPRLRQAPYVVIAHGAEVTVYGRIPGTGSLGRRVLRGAAGVVAAGEYPKRIAEHVARRPLATLSVPPGVDPDRFRPSDAEQRRATRVRFGFDPDLPLVLGFSRLVPRKGFDVLLDAVAGLDGVQVALAGSGRDHERLAKRAGRLGPRAKMLGRIGHAELPALFGAADVFAMLCRDRWGGLEAEGFGIVFLEAAACGVPSIAGRSGGADEAVVDGETGYVVEPRDVMAVRSALERMLADDALRARLGAAARARVEAAFSYDLLAARLAPLAAGDLSTLT
jgi:phosphatidylinositol alpha-1,6-mannosyltransferase